MESCNFSISNLPQFIEHMKSHFAPSETKPICEDIETTIKPLEAETITAEVAEIQFETG